MAKKIDVKAMLKNAKMEKISNSSAMIFKNPGDKIEGVYRGMKKTTYENKKVNVHMIENVNNQIIDVWESTALQVLQTCEKGDVVSIKFLGKKKGKKGRSFKAFDIMSTSAQE